MREKKFRVQKKEWLFFLLLFTACHTVPIIGRKQVNFFPESDVLEMSRQQYADFLKQNTVQQGTVNDSLVQKVGRNLAGAVTRFFGEKKVQGKISCFKRENHRVQSNEVNSWCMPGGKIVVYTGILPITK